MPTPPSIGFGLSIDHAAFARDMNAIGRKAIPRAAAAVMNRAAREAVVALKENAVDVFDRPKPMTLQAFTLRPARIKHGASATATVSIKAAGGVVPRPPDQGRRSQDWRGRRVRSARPLHVGDQAGPLLRRAARSVEEAVPVREDRPEGEPEVRDPTRVRVPARP